MLSRPKKKRKMNIRSLVDRDAELYELLSESAGLQAAYEMHNYPEMTCEIWDWIMERITEPIKWGVCMGPNSWTGPICSQISKKATINRPVYKIKDSGKSVITTVASWLFHCFFPSTARTIDARSAKPAIRHLCSYSTCLSPTCLMQSPVVAKVKERIVSSQEVRETMATAYENRSSLVQRVDLKFFEVKQILAQFASPIDLRYCTADKWMGPWRGIPIVWFRGQYCNLVRLFMCTLVPLDSMTFEERAPVPRCGFTTCVNRWCYGLPPLQAELSAEEKAHNYSLAFPELDTPMPFRPPEPVIDTTELILIELKQPNIEMLPGEDVDPEMLTLALRNDTWIPRDKLVAGLVKLCSFYVTPPKYWAVRFCKVQPQPLKLNKPKVDNGRTEHKKRPRGSTKTAVSCSTCELTFKTNSELKSHNTFKHMDAKPFKCSDCDYAGKTRQKLQCHFKEAHASAKKEEKEKKKEITAKLLEVETRIRAETMMRLQSEFKTIPQTDELAKNKAVEQANAEATAKIEMHKTLARQELQKFSSTGHIEAERRMQELKRILDQPKRELFNLLEVETTFQEPLVRIYSNYQTIRINPVVEDKRKKITDTTLDNFIGVLRAFLYEAFIPGHIPHGVDVLPACKNHNGCLALSCLYLNTASSVELKQDTLSTYVGNLTNWLKLQERVVDKHTNRRVQAFDETIHHPFLLERFAKSVACKWVFGTCSGDLYTGPIQGAPLINYTRPSVQRDESKASTLLYVTDWLQGILAPVSFSNKTKVWSLKQPKCGFWRCVNVDCLNV